MKSILLPGAFAGLFIGIVFTVLNSLGAGLSYDTHEIINIAAIVIAVIVAQIVAVSRQPLAIAQKFLPRYFAAVLAAVAAAVAYGVIAWLYFAIIDNTYLARFYEQYLERARALAATPAESEQLIAAAEQMKDFVMSPLSQAMVQFGTVLMLGLLTGLVVTALTGRKAAG